MLNSVRRLPIRNAFNMCRRSFVETVGDDVYSADLSQNRKFNGTVLINIRQYYKRDDKGPVMASKKGIALTLQQWERLVEIAPEITAKARELAKDLPEQPKSESIFNPQPYQPNGDQNSPQGSYRNQNRNYYQNSGQQNQGQSGPSQNQPPAQPNNTFKGSF